MNRQRYHRLRTHSQDVPEENVLIACPSEYRDLEDCSDDYDISAKLLLQSQTSPTKKRLIEQALNSETNHPYGFSTNNKGKYSYNRDN
jgi:hypothetical protein